MAKTAVLQDSLKTSTEELNVRTKQLGGVLPSRANTLLAQSFFGTQKLQLDFSPSEVYLKATCTSHSAVSKLQTQSDLLQPLNVSEKAKGIESALTKLQTSVLKSIESVDDASRLTVVNTAKSFVESVTNFDQDLRNTQTNAQQEITDSVIKLNDILKGIFDLNQKNMHASTKEEAISYQGQMEGLIEDLSGYVDITHRSTGKGCVEVSLKSGTALVNAQTYRQFSYESPQDDSQIGKMYISYANSGGSLQNKSQKLALESCGGKFEGLRSAIEDLIPTMRSQLQTFTANSAKILNKGLSFGGSLRPEYISSNAQSPDDVIDCGRATIAVMNKDGTALNCPMSLGVSGQMSLRGVKDRINAFVHANNQLGVSAQSVADGLAGITRMSNIQVIADKVVGNNVSFKISAMNNTSFNGTVEVISAQIGGVAIANLPNKMDVGKGEYAVSTDDLQVQFLGGAQNLTVTYRVVDENGVVRIGTATYAGLDPAVNLVDGQTVQPTPLIAPLAGDLVIANPGLGQFMEAEFVDENGVRLPEDTTQDCYLHIVSGNGKRVAISDAEGAEDNGLCSKLGLNNLLQLGKNPNDPILAVNSDMVAHPEYLPVAPLTPASEVNNNGVVTINQNQVIVEFEDVIPLNLPVVGDTINISFNGQNHVFTFIANGGVPAANQIELGLNWNTTLNNIITALSARNVATQEFNSLVTFERNAINNQLVIKSSVQGITFGIDLNVGGGAAQCRIQQPAPVVYGNQIGMPLVLGLATQGVVTLNPVQTITRPSNNQKLQIGNLSLAQNLVYQAWQTLLTNGLQLSDFPIPLSMKRTISGFLTSSTSSVLGINNDLTSAKEVHDIQKSNLLELNKPDFQKHQIDIMRILQQQNLVGSAIAKIMQGEDSLLAFLTR